MSYYDEIISESPTIYFRLGEASGATAVDSSGTGADGTYTSCTLGQAGITGAGSDTAILVPDGGVVTVPDGAHVRPTGDFTLLGWIKTSGSTINTRYLIRRNTSTLDYWIAIDNSGNIELGANTAGTFTVETSGTDYRDGVWHMVAGTRSGNTWTLYVDGAQAATNTISFSSDSYASSVGDLQIGVETGFFTTPDATIDEVSQHHTALSGARIAELYTAGITAPAVDPIVAPASNERTLWRCYLSADGLDEIEVPISSWQATRNNTERQSFLQVVVPSATSLYASISERSGGTMTVKQCLVDTDGETCTTAISGPIEVIRYDRGPTNASVTIAGYWTASTASPAVRTLQDVRSLSITSGTRARCAIDISLEPGQTASVDGSTFTVSYVNYYVNRTDAYMDVGESAL